MARCRSGKWMPWEISIPRSKSQTSKSLRSFHGNLQIRKMDALRDFHPTLKVTDIKMKPRLKTNLTDFKICPGHVHWPSYILLECISHYISVPTLVCWQRCGCHFLLLREAAVWGQANRFWSQAGCIPDLAAPWTGRETLAKGTNFHVWVSTSVKWSVLVSVRQ